MQNKAHHTYGEICGKTSVELRYVSLFCIVVGALIIIISLFIWHERIFELSLTLMHNRIYQSNYDVFFQIVTQYGMSLILLLYCCLLLRTDENKKKYIYPIIICAVLHFFVAGVFTDIIKLFIDKPRPSEVLVGLTELSTIPHTASFPSAHSAKCVALIVPFVLFLKRKYFADNSITITVTILALAIGYSRIALQKHFLSDVLAGFGVALITIPITIALIHLLHTRYPNLPLWLSHSKRLTLLLCVLAIIVAFASF